MDTIAAQDAVVALEGGVAGGADGPTSAQRLAMRDAAPGESRKDDERAVLDCIAALDHRGAISLCARTLGAPLGRLCYAMLGAQGEADEAVQETLLAAYDSIASFRAEGSVRSFLYGIARRICAKRLEVRTRQARRTRVLAATPEADDASPDALVDDARRGHAVRAALAELRPTEREAVLLRFESDLSYREVGAACGIDEAAARQRVGRALAKLRERLGA